MALCKCGCGQDAGTYSRTKGKYQKGDQRTYKLGHAPNHHSIGLNTTKLKAAIRFRDKLDKVQPPEVVSVKTSFYDKNYVRQGTVISEYPNFYLVDCGNYKTTIDKFDVARGYLG